MTGVEPARVSPPPPQDGVSTNFTTSACITLFVFTGIRASCPLCAFKHYRPDFLSGVSGSLPAANPISPHRHVLHYLFSLAFGLPALSAHLSITGLTSCQALAAPCPPLTHNTHVICYKQNRDLISPLYLTNNIEAIIRSRLRIFILKQEYR